MGNLQKSSFPAKQSSDLSRKNKKNNTLLHDFLAMDLPFLTAIEILNLIGSSAHKSNQSCSLCKDLFYDWLAFTALWHSSIGKGSLHNDAACQTRRFKPNERKSVKIQKRFLQSKPIKFEMELEAAEFEVNFTRKFTVKALTPLAKPHILTLSNLDLLSGRFPVTYFYFYPSKLDTSNNITESLKCSLAKTLTSFYPFAGRIVLNPNTKEPEIMCDNSGALVLEAHANIPLNTLNFYDLDQSLRGNKLVSLYPDIPLQIQVTYYTCGGVSITFTFDHALGDASSFGKFLLSWSDIARNKPISCMPDHQRSLRISARNPPRYHSSLDQSFVKCTMEEIMNIPTAKTLVKRLYFIDNSSINQLQSQACRNGKKRTKIEAVSAYVWKTMVKANISSSTNKTNNATCKMGWLVDGRSRLRRRDHNDQNSNSNMSNYIGNVLSLASGEASVNDLTKGSISDVANMVREAISKVTNEEHFLDLIDWIESHRPGIRLSKIVLGQGGGVPALVLSSGRMFPVAELDFGFGSPVLGTVCSTIERIGVAYMNQRPSAKGDGSWTVSCILWPELAAALESDSIFQPMTAGHLQLQT